MKCGIYIIRDPAGDCYIGSSTNLKQRRSFHFSSLRAGRHDNKRLQRSFDQHGESGLTFTVLLTCSPDELLLREQKAIDELMPTLNISLTAGSNRGVKMSPETCAMLSEIRMNQSAETRAKIAAANRRRTHSEETRAKISASQKGKVLTEDHRAKLSAAAKRRIPRKGYTLSEETRAKISASAKARGRRGPHSDETKAKMSASIKAALARRKAATQ